MKKETKLLEKQSGVSLQSRPARVFIQIPDANQREKATLLQDALKAKGYTVPGIENIASKAAIPKRPNVRYFNASDETTANDVVQTLKSQGFQTAYAESVKGFSVPEGSLEVWLAPQIVHIQTRSGKVTDEAKLISKTLASSGYKTDYNMVIDHTQSKTNVISTIGCLNRPIRLAHFLDLSGWPQTL